ncbi:MAG TPA: TOBE domain-containing protein [Gaiellaceae bacterium]|nr:TOBE domain-containing protein [Gaiellaceae bacterium]
MAEETFTATEAATALGISVDTLRRWDREGRIKTKRDARNRRVVTAKEIDRVRGDEVGTYLSARNYFNGTVTSVEVDGLMAQVEIVVNDPLRVVALVTRDAVDELGLKPGMRAAAVVKSTNVMVQR